MFFRLAGSVVLIGMPAISLVAQQPRAIDLWRMLHDQLTSERGPALFEQLQGAMVPPDRLRFEGTIVSQPSATELIVNVDDKKGDAHLKFGHELKSLVPGTYLYFRGVVEALSKDPYSLTFNVEDEDVVGLP